MRAAITALIFLVVAGTALGAQTPDRPSVIALGAQAPTSPARPATPGTPAPSGAPPQNTRPRAVQVMTLTGPWPDGGLIPKAFSQAGRDQSPALTWSNVPEGTASFALVVHDLDAAIGDGTDDVLHWMVWNIPGDTTNLPAGVAQGPTRPDGSRQIGASGPYYRGPAAPGTGPAHHYAFELYALDAPVNVAPVGESPAATRAAVMKAMAGHVRGKAVYTGLYKRQP